MKFNFKNRPARFSVMFGTEQPKLERPLPPQADGKPFRSVSVELYVEGVGTFTGTSYCSPLDQFNRFEGRKKAVKRLMESTGNKLSLFSKEEKRILWATMLLGRVRTAKRIRVKKEK